MHKIINKYKIKTLGAIGAATTLGGIATANAQTGAFAHNEMQSDKQQWVLGVSGFGATNRFGAGAELGYRWNVRDNGRFTPISLGVGLKFNSAVEHIPGGYDYVGKNGMSTSDGFERQNIVVDINGILWLSNRVGIMPFVDLGYGTERVDDKRMADGFIVGVGVGVPIAVGQNRRFEIVPTFGMTNNPNGTIAPRGSAFWNAGMTLRWKFNSDKGR